jgi:predicted ATPase
MLYELGTGENPFRHDDPADMIKAHLQFVPPRMNERSSEVSTFLSEVVASLVAKEPADRFAAANALVEVLTIGERSAWWTEREPELFRARDRRPRISVRRDTVLHGRERELGLLESAWARAREGDGGVVLVEGEAGIGKTRLMDSLVAGLESEDAHVLYGSYPPSGGMGGISDAILGKFGMAGLSDAIRPYLRVTPSLAPAFAAVVKHEQPPEGTAVLQRDSLHAVLCHLMRGLAAEKPLLWVVDDLHFAEPDARKAVISIGRAVEDQRALLVVTTRPELVEEDVTHLSRLGDFERISLGRLSPREVVALLRDAFQSRSLADKLAAMIAFKSDGVPFFIFEMIRELKEQEHIKALADGGWVETHEIEDIEVPSAVRDLIQARIGGLSEADRILLDMAAVQGFEFDADLLAKTCDRKIVEVLQTLARIERSSGVVRGAGPAYRFDHHQIQEVIYEDLPPRLRLEYHAQ